MYACEQILKLWKWMGSINVFIGCSLFDMYVKHGSKKIWHAIITLVCDSKSFIRVNKYNIVFIPFRSNFGHILILMWFSSLFFHKVQMYETHIVFVMEASVECMCSNTNAIENQSKYTHEQTIVGSNLVHVHAKCGN